MKFLPYAPPTRIKIVTVREVAELGEDGGFRKLYLAFGSLICRSFSSDGLGWYLEMEVVVSTVFLCNSELQDHEDVVPQHQDANGYKCVSKQSADGHHFHQGLQVEEQSHDG